MQRDGKFAGTDGMYDEPIAPDISRNPSWFVVGGNFKGFLLYPCMAAAVVAAHTCECTSSAP